MSNPMEALHTLGLNPFAVTLLAESMLKSAYVKQCGTKPLTFEFPVRRAIARAGPVSASPSRPCPPLLAWEATMRGDRPTPKERVLAAHPDAVCERGSDGQWRVFSHRVAHQSKPLGDPGSTPNFAWEHAAMRLPRGVPPTGPLQQVAAGMRALDEGHDPLCMAVLRGKDCTCGVGGNTE